MFVYTRSRTKKNRVLDQVICFYYAFITPCLFSDLFDSFTARMPLGLYKFPKNIVGVKISRGVGTKL